MNYKRCIILSYLLLCNIYFMWSIVYSTEFNKEIEDSTFLSPPEIKTKILPDGKRDSEYTFQLECIPNSSNPELTWEALYLPPNLSIDEVRGIISGDIKSDANDLYLPYISVHNDETDLKTGLTFEFNIRNNLLILTNRLKDTVAGSFYESSLESQGGTPSLTWTSSPESPIAGGISLSRDGKLSGHPTISGNYNINFQVVDSSNPPQKNNKELSIKVLDALVIKTEYLPSGTINQLYEATLQSAGGTLPHTWTINGSLPKNIELSPQGKLSGTITKTSLFDFKVQVKDNAYLQQIVEKHFYLDFLAPLSIDTKIIEGSIHHMAGEPFETWLRASGGQPPYLWSIVDEKSAKSITLSKDGRFKAYGSADLSIEIKICDSSRGSKPLLDFIKIKITTCVT